MINLTMFLPQQKNLHSRGPSAYYEFIQLIKWRIFSSFALEAKSTMRINLDPVFEGLSLDLNPNKFLLS